MFRGLKQPIPKHINDQAKAARLARPDFYVGPTVPKTPPGTRSGDLGRDPDIEAHMTELREEDQRAARQLARELSETTAKKRALKKKRGYDLSALVRLFRRKPLRRIREAR